MAHYNLICLICIITVEHKCSNHFLAGKLKKVQGRISSQNKFITNVFVSALAITFEFCKFCECTNRDNRKYALTHIHPAPLLLACSAKSGSNSRQNISIFSIYHIHAIFAIQATFMGLSCVCLAHIIWYYKKFQHPSSVNFWNVDWNLFIVSII